jgi:hypothetical protein
VHPLVTSSGILWFDRLARQVDDVEFLDYLRYYKAGSLRLMKAGPGDVALPFGTLRSFRLPFPLYSRRALLRTNRVVVTAMLVSVSVGLFGGAVRMISMGGKDGSNSAFVRGS